MSDADNSSKSKPVVMIVDNDPHVRELAGYILTQAGYEVKYAIDGYDALDKVRLLSPSVLLADIVIPRLDGLALCRLVKSDAATRDIRVVIFSEIVALDKAKKAQNACADSFLSKPVEKASLLAAIARVVDPLRSNLI